MKTRILLLPHRHHKDFQALLNIQMLCDEAREIGRNLDKNITEFGMIIQVEAIWKIILRLHCFHCIFPPKYGWVWLQKYYSLSVIPQLH